MAGQNKERNYAMNKILIIDDDRELCALIKRSVQSEHIEADFCNTGKEGLQKLKEQEYQLVVLDVMMPGMDGFETLEEIRKENSLPILMFTSKNDSISKVRGLRAGADDYLTKPFDMDELIAELDVIIKRLYEDNISGKLSDERFIKLSRDYELEQTNLTNLVEHLRQEVKEQEKQKVNVRQFIAAVRKYTDMQQLDASILREFVDKIYVSEVYTPDENEPRIKVREIEIVYNFIGAFDFEEARDQSQAAQKEKKTGVA